MSRRVSPLVVAVLLIVAASGIAVTVLTVIDATVTGDWVDATSAVGYPAVGVVLLALAGLGVFVFLAAVTLLIAALVTGSRTAASRG